MNLKIKHKLKLSLKFSLNFRLKICLQICLKFSLKSQNQSQNQTKTYAQIAAVNVEQNNLQQTKQQEKQQEKEKYREKRLIIQIDKETAEDFDSYILRNKINDRFFTEVNINQSVIATATKFFTSLSIILTTMPDFSANFLLQKKTI